MAALGIPTFPCNAKKKPCCRNGFYDATADTDEMRALWRAYPGPLIGMPCGHVTGLDLLDIDPRNGGLDWLAEFASYLPETRTVFTQSGGTHFFFKHHPGMRNSENKIADGVDVRGTGGYAVLWLASGGSLANNAPPVQWPEWLAEKALAGTEPVAFDPQTGEVFETFRRREVKPATVLKVSKKDKRTADEIALDIINEQIDNVLHAKAGNLHYTVRSASRTIGGLIGQIGFSTNEAGMMIYDAAKSAGGKDMKNAAKTIMSGLELGRSEPLVIGARL